MGPEKFIFLRYFVNLNEVIPESIIEIISRIHGDYARILLLNPSIRKRCCR